MTLTLNELLSDDDSRKKVINMNLVEYIQDRKVNDRRYAIDASKIKNELGWKQEMIFSKGIKKTVKWYIENGL